MAMKTNLLGPQIVDELIKDCKKPADVLGEGGLIKQLTKAILERMLEGEMATHLGYEKHEAKGHHSGNSRNGYTEKTLIGKEGEVSIEVPRDRNAEFLPQVVSKHQTKFDGFDDKIISLYSRGMTTRDIQAQLKDLYGVEVSATLISNVTNEVIEEVKAWQSRPLEKVYPIVYLDALVIKINEDKRVLNKAFYLALGVNMEGEKELLGIWISQNEGAKFWLNVLTELKNRGLEAILIACLAGFCLKTEVSKKRGLFKKILNNLCRIYNIFRLINSIAN